MTTLLSIHADRIIGVGKPVGQLLSRIDDGIVIDTPTNQVLLAVSLETQLIGALLTDRIAQFVARKAIGEVVLHIAESAAAHGVHGIDRIDDRTARLVERLGEEQQYVGVAQHIPVDIRLVIVDDIIGRVDILLGVPLGRREELTLLVEVVLGRTAHRRKIGHGGFVVIGVLVVGDRELHTGIAVLLPFAREVIGHLPVSGVAAADSLDSRSNDSVPFADTSGGIVGIEARRRIERHFDQALARVPDTVAGVLPDGLVIGDQPVLTRLHDAAGHFGGLLPLRFVAHGIPCPCAIDLSQQPQRRTLREAVGGRGAFRIVGGPRKHLGGILEVLFDKGVDIGRIGLHIFGGGNVRIGRRFYQHDVAVPAHQLEIEQCAQRTGLTQINLGQFAVAGTPAVLAGRHDLDKIVGVVDRRIEFLPCIADLRGVRIMRIGRDFAERSVRTAFALGDVRRNGEQQRQVVGAESLYSVSQDQGRWLELYII